jgi:uncharacterized protein (TIGR02466 family)
MSLLENYIFSTPIYIIKKEEWVEKINEFSNKYIIEAKEKNLSHLENKDFGKVHHSTYLTKDLNFKEFINYINKNAFNILNNQGYDLENYTLATTELWVQEFSSLGGGYHSSHVHWNGHVSGFYFLKCSDKTSYPIFHDPRTGRMMNLLPEKNLSEFSLASSSVHIKVKQGDFIFFNSYLQHEFPITFTKDCFRFIHFNIQAFPKQILNNQ